MQEEKNENQEVHAEFKKFAELPVFSDIKNLVEMIPWVPFIFTTVVVFVIVLLVQVIRMYFIDPAAAITYGAVMSMFLLSLAIAVGLGFIVRFIFTVGLRKKFKQFGFFGGRMKISVTQREEK